MFILSNYNQKTPFKISKSNDLDVIESQVDNLKFFSIEKNSPVQFFCIQHIESDTLSSEDLIPAKYFTVETIFEKEIIPKIEDTNMYSNLITDFGDKKSREKNAKKGLVSYAPKETITFNIENQLIPPFDKDASTPKDAYSIDLMFEPEVINKFENTMIDVDDLTDFVKTIYDPKQKKCMIALDCIYRLISERNINEYTLGKYRFFYLTIRDSLVKGRLPGLLRDKFVVKFYVILLIASNFEFNFELLPKFFLTREKVTSFLKMVGCTINKNGLIRLEVLPKDTFTTKRQKRQ